MRRFKKQTFRNRKRKKCSNRKFKKRNKRFDFIKRKK